MLRNLAALALAGPILLAGGAFAATSGSQSGTFNVPYACSVQPGSTTLTVSGTSASGTSETAYSQNSDTVYSLTELSFDGPLGANNAAYSGTVAFQSAAGTSIVSNSSTSSSASGNLLGLANDFGLTTYSVSTSEEAFRAGNYSISATLSCAQLLD